MKPPHRLLQQPTLMNKACTIILNSNQYPSHLEDIIAESDLSIATDGAWDCCLARGITPDYVIGDMDSLVHTVAEEKKIYAPDQNATDGEKAIIHALKLGYNRIHLVGICGHRLDHTLYHLQLIQKYQDSCTLTAYSENERCWIAKQPQSIAGRPGQRIAFIRISDTPPVLATRGLEWPVTRLERHSVSNRFNSHSHQVHIDEIKPQGTPVCIMLGLESQ